MASVGLLGECHFVPSDTPANRDTEVHKPPAYFYHSSGARRLLYAAPVIAGLLLE